MKQQPEPNNKHLFGGFFRQKRVFVTGHTGFKGSWLTAWLLELGAEVAGYALPAKGRLFSQLGLADKIQHEEADIRNLNKLEKSISRFRPDLVFHLAAQPLVRESYRRPLETYEINTLGTGHVLEALRKSRHPCAVVFVTTDKVYRNQEKCRAFREEDALGGKDPYSGSKAAAEVLIESYRDSFFQNHPVRIASARSGNVIGGGDYAEDRIVPDAFRALRMRRAIPVRNPKSIRPWQHVLEPTSGYLALAVHLFRDRKIEGAYNFGPSSRDEKTVAALVREILKKWPGRWERLGEKNPPHEAGRLQLNNRKAWQHLRWKPRLSFAQSVGMTMDWYRASIRPAFDAYRACQDQIQEYSKSCNP